ncbi:uncharacterized protein LOC134825851 [Bolinopsis microptera]|uniref:uncharacterized protein LOC134825851 n=1 Tax=Bolinopsis microptera TaxID=2820187 RepID=UPI0030797A59
MTMSFPLLTVLLALQFTFHSVLASKALQFGTTLEDYVKFSPDMSQVKSSLTVCSWVKKQLPGATRSWITYTTTTHRFEILISDGGSYNYIHDSNNDLTSSIPTVVMNTWTNQCQSWSQSSGKMKTYYNGTLVGSKSVSSAPLEEGGVITLGHDAGSPGESEIFGGQLMKLDIFGKELSAEQVSELYNAGRCSNTEKKHQEVRFITWESILSQDRTGNVTEVDSGCPAEEEEEEEEEEEDCKCSHSIWDILYDQTYFNQTLTAENLTKLKSAWNMLDHFVGTSITENIIAHFKAYHPMPAEEEDEETEEGDCECSHSIWDVLNDQTYSNQTLTAEKLTELKAAWNMLDHFVGTPITENIIAHFKTYHPMPAEEDDSS